MCAEILTLAEPPLVAEIVKNLLLVLANPTKGAFFFLQLAHKNEIILLCLQKIFNFKFLRHLPLLLFLSLNEPLHLIIDYGLMVSSVCSSL